MIENTFYQEGPVVEDNPLTGNPISFPSLDAPLGGTTRSRGQKLMGVGGGADLPTKLRALGAMVGNKVPEFRQQQMQEREAESMLGVQELQKREMLDKSLAKDYFTAYAMAENGDYQGFMALMEDRLRNERKLGLDTSSTLEIMQDAQGPDGMATVMPYLKSTLESAFAAGYLTPAEMSKPLDRFRMITREDRERARQAGIALPDMPLQVNIDTGRIENIDGYTSPSTGSSTREMEADQNGILRYVDTGEPVFPNVETEPETPEVPSIKQNQSKASVFGHRAQDASSILDNLESSIIDRNIFATFAQQSMPNNLKSSEQQQFDQATRNFINATLRLESGAAIQQSEFDSATLQYIPQFGDKPEVLEQKRANRERFVEGMKVEAGPAWDMAEDMADNENIIEYDENGNRIS